MHSIVTEEYDLRSLYRTYVRPTPSLAHGFPATSDPWLYLGQAAVFDECVDDEGLLLDLPA